MMNIETIQKNKLGTILRFSIPSIISMLLSTIITITDGYFTGNYVGEDALAAINLGLPILYFYLGVGLCIGVGGSVLCGQLLGSQENRKASEVFSQSVATAFAVCVVTSLAVYLLFPTILRILQANGGLTLYFTQYYRVMLLNYPLMVVGTALGMFIRMDGRPQICMLVSVGSCVLNALLDYVLVARFAMGVLGSAYASLAVQLLSVIAQLAYFFGPSHSIRITSFQFDRAVHRDILLNGSSEFIGEMASAVSMFAFNFVLMRYVGTEGVAAFTILGFAVYGFSMISIGFGQGLTVPVSICWGAGGRKTAMELRIMTIFEKKALYAFGCPNREATVERLHMIAVLAPDCETKKLLFNLAVKLSADCAGRWYPCFFRTLREEMAIYYEAELTMKLAEVSTYDMEGRYGKANQV